MKKEIGNMLGRLKPSKRTRKNRQRKLRVENLEGRRLLASDVADALQFHNPLIAADVDYDFNVSPRDALLVINQLNGEGARELSTEHVNPQGKAFIDVNGDGHLSPLDALMIINDLNGEGETDPLVTYTAQLTDTDGAPITQIVVGQTFRLSVFVEDTRSTGPTGVFQNAIDVGVENHNSITFPTGSASVVNSLTFGSTYTNGRRASAGASGTEATEFINEVTSFATSTTPPDPTGGTYLFFSADIEATAAGSVNFVLNQHENEPTSQVNVFDSGGTLPNNGRIDPSMISYGSASINVVLDPTAPVAVNDNATTAEDTAILLVGGSVDLIANDTIESGRTASVVSISTIAGTTQGTLNGFNYTPPANFFGTDTVTYVVEDSEGLRSSATVTITMTPVNDAPVAADDSFNVDEETTGNVLDVLTNDNGGPLETTDTLTITAVTTPNNGGTATVAADGQSVSYTPDANFVGTETFSYTIRDSGGLEDTALVTIEVEPTVLPRARTDRQTVAEDSTNNSIDVLANDRANDGATVVLVGIATQPANGTVTVDNNGTSANAGDDLLVYTPNANFFGSDTFTYTMNDTAAGSVASTGTVSITVTAVNDAVALVDDTANATEDTQATIAISSLLSNDSPGAGETTSQALTITSVAAVGAGGVVAIVGDNIFYAPASDFNGSFSFTYTAADNGSPVDSAQATVVVTVAAVNDNPTTTGDSASGTEDTQLTIAAATLLANDSTGPANESSQTLSVTAVSAASAQGGTVSLNGTDVVYTPAANFNGSDTFTYTASDGAGGTATGTVTVSVAAVNDAPTAVNDTARAFKDNALQIPAASLIGNDSTGPANESGQTLSVSAVTATADTHGTVVLNSDGSVTFTPEAGYTGPASFQYTVQDSGGGSTDTDTGTVNVTVEEFVPTIISGMIWMDENNDGEINIDVDGDGTVDFYERMVGGVDITLTGVSLGAPITPQTQTTLADGGYSFEDLGPGQYVVTFSTPMFMIDGKDVAGAPGDADAIENQFTVNIAQPGGVDASGYNFAVLGVEAQRARILDQLASRYSGSRGSIEGAFFALGSDNTALWGSLLEGFDGAEFAEAVLSDDGSQLVLSTVDASAVIRSALLDSTQFVKTQDGSGNTLVRIVGTTADFDWQVVNLATPPIVSAANYLESIDEIFAQENWTS